MFLSVLSLVAGGNSHEWNTWYVVGAFLLNMKDFVFLSQQDNRGQHIPSVVSKCDMCLFAFTSFTRH